MTDVKGLVSELKTVAAVLREEGKSDALPRKVWTWIERWAPVVHAATKSQRAGATLLAAAQANLDERYISAAVVNVEDTTAALWSAVAAALGEDKP